jgi:hypothetical protein
MTSINDKLKQDLNDFRLSHYLNADFDSLIEKTINLYRKFESLKV